jgi:hypothetical protein
MLPALEKLRRTLASRTAHTRLAGGLSGFIFNGHDPRRERRPTQVPILYVRIIRIVRWPHSDNPCLSGPIGHRHRFLKQSAQQLQLWHTLSSHNYGLPRINEIPFVTNLMATWGDLFLIGGYKRCVSWRSGFYRSKPLWVIDNAWTTQLRTRFSNVNPVPLTSL